jgi:hypothetical protein
MNGLAKFLVDSILNEDENALGSVALFGGGFKPPTKGHLDVVLQGLRDNPEVKQVYILVGSGVRNGVTQEEAVKIWKIYKKFIPVSTQIVAVQSPFSYIKTYLQDHQDENVYIFIGARPDNDEDEKDVAERSAYAKKYSEKAFPVKVTTPGNVSGTQARAAAITSKEDFLQFIPSKLTDSEKESIYQMVADVVKEKINENASYSSDINVKEKILELTKHMLAKGMNIKPLPKVKFVNGDSNNAREFLGKTAYYDPNNFTITLYTEGRHPKDIVRSFSHEMIHHIQNLENRLGDVSTTNTMEDDNIDKLEQEANLKGTMTFRNWTDSLNENIFKKSTPQTKGYILKTGEVITLEVDPSGLTYGSLNITAYDKDNNKIGTAYFNSDETNDPKILSSTDTSVKPDWRRKGVATAIYNFAKTFGYKIVKSTNQSPEGGKFTDSFNKNLNEAIVIALQHLAEDPKYYTKLKSLGLEEKKEKDPFGLNQYARELAQGLEEAIVGDKIECGNCDWSWDIKDGGDDLYTCHKCGHDNTPKQLNEGRYDKSTNQFSKIVFEFFKDVHDRGDKTGEFEFSVGPFEEDIYSEQFEFDLAGVVEITDDEYKVDGGANAGFDKKGNEITPLLSVTFKIPKNPDWQKVSFDIKDVVRHELEHLTQDGENEKPGKYMKDDQLIRDLIDADMLSKSQYFKLEKEVDAMLQGLYFKAKKSKRPFGDVIDDYLNIFLDQETISPQEKEDILNTWRSRRKALSLPIFEQENMEDKYKIYLDMDGVITDFDKRFTDLAGMGPREYESSFGKDKFWDFIDSKEKGGGVGFWVGMPWMPGGPELYNRISQHNHALLSSPSRSESSKLGKRLWKKKYTPNTDLILSLAANKKNYADGGSILIDDRESNIQQWREAGGIGILYKSADQVNKELDKLGL